MNFFKNNPGVKIIAIAVVATCLLTLLELLAVSFFANANNIQIPVTDAYIATPVALSIFGIASALALLNNNSFGRYSMILWFAIYIVTGIHWAIKVYQLNQTVSWGNILFILICSYCIWFLFKKTRADRNSVPDTGG